jgi:hypothetical protein
MVVPDYVGVWALYKQMFVTCFRLQISNIWFIMQMKNSRAKKEILPERFNLFTLKVKNMKPYLLNQPALPGQNETK